MTGCIKRIIFVLSGDPDFIGVVRDCEERSDEVISIDYSRFVEIATAVFG
jgi:hypothetical protein